MKKKMRNTAKKCLSLLLAAVMLLATQGLPVLAETVSNDTIESVGRDMPKNPVHHCTKSNDGTDTTDWSYVYFGSYPQTEVTGDALTEAITGASYDSSGDAWVNGTKYRRISKSDTNYDGYFGASDYRYFKWERIKWRVFENNGGTLFVVADKGLDCKDYHDPDGSITWENCTLRSWLNSEFYGTAFSSSEQGAIVRQNVVNEYNPYFGTEGGNDTSDNVFLLSIGEVLNPEYGFCEYYSTYSASRRMQASDYAHARGAYANTSSTYAGNCWWWLRSPGSKAYDAASVYTSGDVDRYGRDVTYYNHACVPALHINLSSDLWSTADDGSSGEGGSGGTGGSGTGSIVSPGGSLQCRSSCTVDQGSSIQVTVQAYGDDYAGLKKLTDSVTWKSQNTSIASVKSNGFTVSNTPVSYKTETGDYNVWGAVGSFTVTGIKAGTTTVAGTAWDGSSATCRITVEEPDDDTSGGGSAGSGSSSGGGGSWTIGQDASGSAGESVAQFFPDTWSLKCVAFPVEISRTEDKDGSYKIKGSIGVGRSDLLDNETTWNQYKKSVDDAQKYSGRYNCLEKYRDLWKLQAPNVMEVSKFKKKPKLSVMGYFENNYDKNGKLISRTGKVAADMKWSKSVSWQFATPIGPVYLNLEGSGKVSCNIVPAYNPQKKKVDIADGSLSVTPAVSLEGGYGINKVATIGAKGDLSLPVTVIPSLKGELQAKASLHVKILFVVDYSHELASYKKTLWGGENKENGRSAYSTGISLSAGTLSVMDASFADYTSAWNGRVEHSGKTAGAARRSREAAFGETVLMDGILPSSLPMQAEINGKKVMVFQSYDSTRDTLDSSVLQYSVCENDEWSDPQPVWDNGCADLYADLKTVNGKLVLVWQKQKAKAAGNLDADADAVLEQIAKNSEICFAEFDEAAGTFINQTYVTDNEVYDMMPKICGGTDEIVLSWVRNDAADLMQESGTNTIYTSAWNGSSFESEAPLVQSFGTVDDYVVYQDGTERKAVYAGEVTGGEGKIHLLFDEGNREIESLSGLVFSSEDAALSEMQYVDGNVNVFSGGALYSYHTADKTTSAYTAGENVFGSTARYCSNGDKSGYVWSVYDEESGTGRIVASMAAENGYCDPVTLYEKEGVMWRYISPVLKEDGSWEFLANAMQTADGQENHNSLIYIEKQQEAGIELAGASVNAFDTKDGLTGIDYYLTNTSDSPIHQLQMELVFADGTVKKQEILVAMQPGESAVDTVYVDLSDVDSAQEVSISIYAKDQSNIEDCTVTAAVGQADVEVAGTAEESDDMVSITANLGNSSNVNADTTLYLYSDETCAKELCQSQTGMIPANGSRQFAMQVKKEAITYNENDAAYLTLKAVVKGGDYNEDNNISYVILYKPDSEEGKDTEQKELENAKSHAKQELESYKNASDYRTEQKSELARAIADGKEAIDAAADETGVASALAAAKAELDKIKTDAQLTEEEKGAGQKELENAKSHAKQELESYKNASDYRTEQKSELARAIADGKEAIDAAADETKVASALAAAKAELDKIKTDAQLTEEEKETSGAGKPGGDTNKPSNGSQNAGGSGSSSETAESLSKAKVKLKKSSYTYNGKAKKPGVTVKLGSKKLTKDKDYKLTYKNNKKVGTASVIITGTGNYTGALTKTFKIVPKGTTVSGKIKAKSKGFTVSWKKQKSVTGYQLQYSTSKKFAKKATVTKTIKKKSATKWSSGKLKPNKIYYIRLRTYQTVKGKKYESAWSKAKTVKTRK